MIKRLSLVFLVLLAFQACKKDNISEAPMAADSEKMNNLFPSKSLDYIAQAPAFMNVDGVTFYQNIPYRQGLDADLNKFDIFIPESNTPDSLVPLVIYIHGGGFEVGDKDSCYTPMWNGSWDFPSEINTLLDTGIAFATINYRLLADGDLDGVKKPLNDSKRCLQFIRAYSDSLGIDKDNIVLAGSSAGGGTAQWLAFQDDMADASNPNIVFQQSTRVKGIALKATQASYDLDRYVTDVFDEYGFTWQALFNCDTSMVARFKAFYGINTALTEELFYSPPISTYRERVDMIAMMSPDDPEFWVANLQTAYDTLYCVPNISSVINHHAFQARTLKEYADLVGIDNVTYYGNPNQGTEFLVDPSGETFVDFLIRKIEE